MDRVEQLISELAECRDVTIMTMEEFLDILTKDIEDDEQLELDLDSDKYN